MAFGSPWWSTEININENGKSESQTASTNVVIEYCEQRISKIIIKTRKMLWSRKKTIFMLLENKLRMEKKLEFKEEPKNPFNWLTKKRREDTKKWQKVLLPSLIIIESFECGKFMFFCDEGEKVCKFFGSPQKFMFKVFRFHV